MVNEKFLITLQGKNYVTYEGLLDLAHQKGLQSLEVDIIQFPSQDNNMTAICKAVAKTENESYIDIGDASPKSVNNALIPHIIRMASTRAKARALRDLTNVGMTSIEELSYEEGNPDEGLVQESTSTFSPPTQRQVDTIKRLAEELNYKVNFDKLDKQAAGNLIGKLLDEKKARA